MELTEIKELGKRIPHGKQGEIADKTGFSQSYVSRFFSGEYQLSGENACIITEAKRLVQENEEKIKNALK